VDTTFLTLGLFLVGVGFLLLVGEMFLPSAGVLLMLALGSLVVGIAFVFKYDTYVGLYTVGGVFLAMPLLGGLMIKLWPHTPLGRSVRAGLEEQEEASRQEPPGFAELRQLVGRHGKTLTSLRPGGMVDFEGKRVDCLTEGMLVEPGRWVRCIDVKGNKVIVRPVDRPETFDLETATFNE